MVKVCDRAGGIHYLGIQPTFFKPVLLIYSDYNIVMLAYNLAIQSHIL